MRLPKHIMPDDYFSVTPKTDVQITALPFYIKEVGYCNDRKFIRGACNNYSDYLFVYSLCTMKFKKNDEKHPVHSHDIIVSACNTPLTFSLPISYGKTQREYLYFIIGGSHAQQFYNYIRRHGCTFHFNKLHHMLDLFLEILEIDYKSDPMSAQMHASSVVHQIYLELYILSQNILNAQKQTPVQDSAVNTALKYIQTHYQSDLSIDAVCNSVSFSKYYFCKLFKEHMGISIHQYVTEFRINKSKELLSYSKLSISAIATSVGFKNALTYTRNFEKLEHMTPSEYSELY